MLDRFHRLLALSTTKSGLSFVASGLSFAVANLILASTFSVDNYAILALLIAIAMFSTSIGMGGADGIVNRHPMAPDPHLFGRVALSSAIVAILVAFLATEAYRIPMHMSGLLIPVIVAFAITRICGAYLQARLRMIESLVLFNSLNYLILAVALLSIVTGLNDVTLAILIITVLQCIIAVVAVLMIRSQYRDFSSDYEYSWREALAYVFMVSSLEMLVQLERLVTPRVLGLDDLAVLGVLLAIVGPPFRLLYLTFGYDLLPALRNSEGNAERIALLARHSFLALLMIPPLWVVIWFAVPLIQKTFLSDEYAMSGQLIVAALVGGTIKAFSGIARASVTALASVKGMEIMGAIGWVSIGFATVAAWYGSKFGLAGVVYGVTTGWAIRLLATPIIIYYWLDDRHTIPDESLRARTLTGNSSPD